MDLTTILQSQLKHETQAHLDLNLTSRNLNTTHLKIIEHVWLNSEISRSELALVMQLNKSSITRAIDELKLWNVVSEQRLHDAKATKEPTINLGSKKKGRPPLLLKINPELGVVLGIELRTDEYQLVILDTQGQVRESSLRKFPFTNQLNTKNLWDRQAKDFFLKCLDYVLCEVQRVIQAEERPVLGMAIGLSGMFHSGKNILLYSDLFHVQKAIPVTKLLDQFDFSFPVFLNNDVRCCAWMELHNNKKRHDNRPQNFLSVLGDFNTSSHAMYYGDSPIAIGLSFVIDNQVITGETYAAGEFQSIFKKQENLSQFNVSDGMLQHLYTDQNLVRKILQELCRNLAFLIVTLDLQEVHFLSDIVVYAQDLTTGISNAVAEQWPHRSEKKVSIQFSQLGKLSVAVGAATYALQKIFVKDT